MAKEQAFQAVMELRVRYVETDQMGVVHHASYLDWLEEGRMDYMRQRGLSYSMIEEMGFFLPVVECKVRYLAPARFEQELVLRSWIKELQPLMTVFAYRLEDKHSGTLHLTGQTKHVCVDRAGEVQEIPRAWVERVAPEMLDQFDF
ncbi:MAG: acyl-CoA thioesterase [Myxococcales bacterium]|nr:acyl-CoA thioesterase [Myxococcales bacterium]